MQFVPVIYVQMCRVGQNRIHTPYMTVYLVISLPYTHRIYLVLAHPAMRHCLALEAKNLTVYKKEYKVIWCQPLLKVSTFT